MEKNQIEGNVEILSTDEIGEIDIDESMLTDIKDILEAEYQKDVLFEILCGLGRKEEVITEKMREELNREKLYSTGEAATLLDIKRSTISTWVKGLLDYIEPNKDGKNYKLDYESIFKLRMVSLLRQNNQYTITKIREMTSDIEVVDLKQEMKKEKEKPLNARVKELEEKLQKYTAMEYKVDQVGQALAVLLRGLDEEVLIKLQQGEDPSNIIPKFRQDLLPKPEITAEEVDELVKKEIDKVYDEFEKDKESLREEIRKEIEEEIERQNEQRSMENEKLRKAIEEMRTEKKGFWQKLFGR
ncbi:MerR family transcriptional regulator [Wukongibacter baidiensis]